MAIPNPPAARRLPPAWAKLPLYGDPANDAIAYAQSHPTLPDAQLIQRMGSVPVANWFGDWDGDTTAKADQYVTSATVAQAVPVLVLYNIPHRDCGGYSAGGAVNETAYLDWVKQVAAGIGGRTAVTILEPDALPGLDCLSKDDQQARYQMLSSAVTILKANPGTAVYIDAGNPDWQSVDTIGKRLREANIAEADGFSLNVSNYISTSQNQHYGDAIAARVGWKHYVIDTSRNGSSVSSKGPQCNNPGAALGAKPTTQTGHALNDAFLWVKIPWESGGACNGEPAAGMPFWSYAVRMAHNAGWQQ